jgi:hypothetical protein
MPILHFSGRFKNYPPLYNNYPWNQEKYFDSEIPPDEVKAKVTEKVDPLQYFEFEFSNVYIKKVTYDNGTNASSRREDPVIGKEIKLRGLLVDTSPHLERGRLFAGEIRIIDFVLAKLTMAVQSDLFKSIRNDSDKGASIYSAEFESSFYDSVDLINEFLREENSEFVREMSDRNKNNLKIYFNLSLFDFESLEGEVYGYVGPFLAIEDKNGVRISGRRLLVDPTISPDLKRDFGIKQNQFEDDLEPTDNVLRNDMEGSYEILREDKLVILRYINFIPFQDIKRKLPDNYIFTVTFLIDGKKTELASPIIIDPGKDGMSRNGGICIFKLPKYIEEPDKLSLEVNATKKGGVQYKFLQEPPYDIMLENNQRFLTLHSGKKEELRVRVYKKNRLYENRVTIMLKSESHPFSPSVAWWSGPNTVAENGIAVCYAQARDLENSPEVEDPTLPKLSEKEKPHMISGELPWDRYYGNYLSLKIDSKEKPTIKLNIPVRVLHSVKPIYVESIDGLKKEKIQDLVTKMLSYYARYYPWLHVEYRYVKDKKGNPKLVYLQFLKIKEHLDFRAREDLHDWHSCQEIIEKINHFLERLEKDDSDWKKMPRSRDFPHDGIKFLKAWKSSLVNKIIQDINESKGKTIEDNRDIMSDGSLDINDWDGVETLVDGLDNVIKLVPSLSIENKKILLMNKIAIYQFMLEKLNETKFQTKHVHEH